MKEKLRKKQIARFLVMVIVLSCLPGFSNQNVEAKDYSANGCVNWVKDRASAKLGITLPSTGLNKYGLYGANNYWYILNYSKGSEPKANSLAIWEFNNGSDGAGGKYGHVAFVESVDGDSVTVTEGGCIGYTYDGNTGVICRTQNKSQMATLGGCSGFLGYVYLTGSTPVYYDPKGSVDTCQSTEIGKLRVAGWAYDPDSPSTQNEIHVYIGPNDNDIEGYNLGPANGLRQDVDDAEHCGAYHGFDDTISTNRTGNQRVRIFAQNVDGGNDTLLYDNTVYIKQDTEVPALVGYDITNLNDKGYTITCTWRDNIGVTKVEFPTWDSEKTGSDATWYPGTSSEAGKTESTWKFIFSEAEEGRKYFTHIYASDAAGNRTCFPLTRTTPIASPIEAKNDTTAPVFEDVALTQEEEGAVTLSVQLSDDVGLGKLSRPGGRFLWYSADENSSSLLADYSSTIKSNINCWNDQGGRPILEKEYTVEETTSVQCDSIVGYGILAQDLSGNYAVGNSLLNNEYISYQIRSGHVKGQKNKSIEIRLNQGEEITLGAIREKLSQLNNLDSYDVYFDSKNERILEKSNYPDSNMNREEEKKVVLTANEPGTEYVYFLNLLTGGLCSCKIQVKSENIGDVYQDGVIDGKDVSLLLQYRLKKRELTEEQIAIGDVYADGKIDGKDVSKLLQYRLGKISSLE